MTPRESQILYILYGWDAEGLSVIVFLYGVSSSLVVQGQDVSLITGMFFVLFSASVVILTFVSASIKGPDFFANLTL